MAQKKRSKFDSTIIKALYVSNDAHKLVKLDAVKRSIPIIDVADEIILKHFNVKK